MMKLNAWKVGSGVALLAAAWGFASPAMAAGGTVSYACQNGKTVNVRYQFNSAGKPVTAQAVLDGANRVMRYDARRSDGVDTYLKDSRGYRLGTGHLDVHNYQTNSINLQAPDGEVLFKSCIPQSSRSDKGSESARGRETKGHNVAYACQNKRRLNVLYYFDASGTPTRAVANIQGRNYTLNYDQAASDDVDSIFTGRGYRMSGGNINVNNYRWDSSVMVTAPNNQLLYKNCTPVRR